MLGSLNLRNRISKLSIGLGGVRFSRRIGEKYGILRRSNRLFSLIFYRLFSKKVANKKINFYQKESFNNYFKCLLLGSGNLTTAADGKNIPVLYSGTSPASIYLNYLHPVYIGNLHGAIGAQKAGSEARRLIHFQTQTAGNEKPTPGSQTLKIVNEHLADSIAFVMRITNPSMCRKNTHREGLTTEADRKNIPVPYAGTSPASVHLNYLNPVYIANSYGAIGAQKASSEAGRVIHFQPLAAGNEKPTPGSQTLKIVNEHLADSIAFVMRITNPSMWHGRKNTHREGLTTEADGKNIPVPYAGTSPASVHLNYLHPVYIGNLHGAIGAQKAGSEARRLIHFQTLAAGSEKPTPRSLTTKIAIEFLAKNIAIIRRTTNPLLQHVRALQNTGSEDIANAADGKNILFPYSGTSPTSINLNYTNPINIGNLHGAFGARKAGSEAPRLIHFQIPAAGSDKTSPRSQTIKIVNEHLANGIAFVRRITDISMRHGRKNTRCGSLTTEADGKNIPVPYSGTGPASVYLNYLNPVYIGNLHGAFGAQKAGSEAPRLIHFQIPAAGSDKTSPGSQTIKIVNEHLANGIDKIKRTPVDHRDVAGHLTHSPGELILKNSLKQSTDFASENRAQLQTNRPIPPDIADNSMKEPFKEKPIYEINKIADTVYKIIERRISIEKDRRGLF